MRDVRIAAVQFEYRDGDKEYNLSRIRELTRDAVDAGAEIVSFPECCIPAYSFVQPFSKSQMLELAEPVPDGPGVRRLMEVSAEFNVPLLAGLFERDGDDVFNTYVCVDGGEFVAKHRKLHAFVNPHLTSGSQFTVFELRGCPCGILICYDNNLPENVRITAMMGAEVVFMPHVTGCLPSVMPGRGIVSSKLWHNRERDPVALRKQFGGPKGREWLMRWLPARAYENGVYAVFTNPVGLDNGEVRNGNAMIVDPFGEILAECNELGDGFALGFCTGEKIGVSSGRRYIRARRPELYGKLVEPSAEPPVTSPGWKLNHGTDAAGEAD